MDLRLEHDEAAILQRILDEYLGDLRMEIADTDTSHFKDDLRREQTLIEGIRDRLAAVVGQPRP